MNNFKFKITEEFMNFINKQVTQTVIDQEYYLKLSQSEYDAFKEYIDAPKNILELGCGLGRMSIFLNHQLEQEAKFILADFSLYSENIKYGWNPKESYYNNLEYTEKFAKLNNLHNFNLFDLKNDDISRLSNVDLVMSFLSVGFHYPIEQYFLKLLKITSDDAVMIFGIRNDIDIDFYKKYFNNVIINNNTVNTKERILILKGKIL